MSKDRKKGFAWDEPTRSGTILVVDDDPEILGLIISFLEQHNLPAIALQDRKSLARHLAMTDPSIVLLDLRLGPDDGLDVLRDIRSQSDVPVIIMTAHHPDEIDRVIGLEAGADDYLVKPFSLRELLARIRAVRRRHELGRLSRSRAPERGGYRFGRWHLERRRRRLSDHNDVPVPLSPSEYALLIAFLESPNRPLTREFLQQATRVYDDVQTRSIDVRVLRLRQKLESDPNSPRMIVTERGVGYTFTMPVEPF
jgi:two-component system OmpR family response regulator